MARTVFWKPLVWHGISNKTFYKGKRILQILSRDEVDIYGKI